MIKKGQILKYKNRDDKAMVLAVLGDVYLLSTDYDYDITSCWYTQKEIEKDFILPEETWEPDTQEVYWYVDDGGNVDWTKWYNDEIDNARKNFLGIFKTKEDAQKRLDEIKSKI